MIGRAILLLVLRRECQIVGLGQPWPPSLRPRTLCPLASNMLEPLPSPKVEPPKTLRLLRGCTNRAEGRPLLLPRSWLTSDGGLGGHQVSPAELLNGSNHFQVVTKVDSVEGCQCWLLLEAG